MPQTEARRALLARRVATYDLTDTERTELVATAQARSLSTSQAVAQAVREWLRRQARRTR